MENHAEQLFFSSSEYQRLIAPYLAPQSQQLLDWKNSPYNKSCAHPEKLIHKSISGNLLRSKSEVLIDMSLYKHKIPFRYECELQLGNISIFPDFTILHPTSGKIIYWEHFGMMDIPKYRRNACQKLYDYSENGIIPSIQLITTFETKEHPLSTDTVEKIVQE